MELKECITLVTVTMFFNTLSKCWLDLCGTAAKREVLILITAHWGFETGWGKYMHNYNVGNIKTRPDKGRDYCYYACTEIMGLGIAKQKVKEQPVLAKIIRTLGPNSALVGFTPKHPECCFRAFKSLEEGINDYLAFILNRLAKVRSSLDTGDPVAFSRALKSVGYYTDTFEHYSSTLNGCYKRVEIILSKNNIGGH